MGQIHSNDSIIGKGTRITCPFCYHQQKALVKKLPIDDNRINVAIVCRMCRRSMSERVSTLEIEATINDIMSLKRKAETHPQLAEVYRDRLLALHRLMREERISGHPFMSN